MQITAPPQEHPDIADPFPTEAERRATGAAAAPPQRRPVRAAAAPAGTPGRAAGAPARLAAWVEAQRGFAAAKPDPEAHLMAWHDWLGGELAALAATPTPPRLAGLSAWDLAEAQIALIRPLAAKGSA